MSEKITRFKYSIIDFALLFAVILLLLKMII